LRVEDEAERIQELALLHELNEDRLPELSKLAAVRMPEQARSDDVQREREIALAGKGGTGISYTARARQPLSIPIVELIYRDLSVHGYWLNRWLQRTAADTIAQTYHELATLVADGTLAALVEATYALADYRDAIAHSAQSERNGKVLFATDQR